MVAVIKAIGITTVFTTKCDKWVFGRLASEEIKGMDRFGILLANVQKRSIGSVP